jgi:hypothetical protein
MSPVAAPVGLVAVSAVAEAAAGFDPDEMKRPDAVCTLQCPDCTRRKDIAQLYRISPKGAAAVTPTILEESKWHCRSCLRSAMLDMLQENTPVSIKRLEQCFSNLELSDILTVAEFNQYLDRTCQILIESSKQFVQCPKCSNAMEIEYHSFASKSSPDYQPAEAVGIDNQPLTEDAKKHFLANRLMCAPCGLNFCRSCRQQPYHLGFDCKEYNLFLQAPKCRFCGVAVTDRNKLQVKGAVVPQCCSAVDCAQKSAVCCKKILGCGHFCAGCVDEKQCPPCLHPDCEQAAQAARVFQTAENECAICFAEGIQ